MKHRLSTLVPVAFALSLATSCGEGGEVKAGELIDGAKNALGSLENLDLSNLSADAAKKQLGGFAEQITTKLADIKDVATAENAKKTVGPMLDQLKGLQTKYADKMPDLSSFKTAADNLMQKFGGDSKIMEVLKPIIDKLKSIGQ